MNLFQTIAVYSISIITCSMCCSNSSLAQAQPIDSTSRHWQAGAELDVLPYATGGYFAAGWVGKKQLRLRSLYAVVNKPSFLLPDGFAAYKIQSAAVLVDYFRKPNWQGFWVGAGLVYWNNELRTDANHSTGHFDLWLANGSMGYHWRLGKRFYISPWAGMSMRVAGAKAVAAGPLSYKPPFLNPELSVKGGIIL